MYSLLGFALLEINSYLSKKKKIFILETPIQLPSYEVFPLAPVHPCKYRSQERNIRQLKVKQALMELIHGCVLNQIAPSFLIDESGGVEITYYHPWVFVYHETTLMKVLPQHPSINVVIQSIYNRTPKRIFVIDGCNVTEYCLIHRVDDINVNLFGVTTNPNSTK